MTFQKGNQFGALNAGTKYVRRKKTKPTVAPERIGCVQHDCAQCQRVESLVREIHQALKRGKRTQDHGVVGNLKCILDHVCRDGDPAP